MMNQTHTAAIGFNNIFAKSKSKGNRDQTASNLLHENKADY